MENRETGLLKFIACGSVDDGKSTLIGHILYDSKLLYADQEKALLLDSQIGSRGGAIDYSLLLDGLMAEREQGITIDVAYRYFTTDARSFIVADTPGHEEYTRNMAVGASFAELSVILVDATRGVLAQTRRHARICALMGIRHFVFAVNKMDLIDYNPSVFSCLCAEIEELIRELSLENYVVIPVSATEGDNVTKLSSHTPWYEGKTLLKHLETVNVSGDTLTRGFCLPVQRVCRPDHTFRGFQGQVESGAVAVGDPITVLPGGEKALVKSIFIGDQVAETAVCGQPVTLQLDREVDVSRGCVLTGGGDLKTAREISATLLWMDDQELRPGVDYWLKVGARMLPAIVARIRHRVEINSGTLHAAEAAEKNDIVQCDILLSQPAAVDEFRRNKTLGALILIDRVHHATAACGVIDVVTAGGREDDNYPDNFDIPTGHAYAQVRGGVLTGFGPRDESMPLFPLTGSGDASRAFKLVCLWEKEDSIEYEI